MNRNSTFSKPEPKKKRSGWLIGCLSGALIAICLGTFILIGGFAGFKTFFTDDPEEISVDLSVPSSSISVGDPFQVSVTLTNEGTKNVTVNEIQLPDNLISNMLVTGVTPASLEPIDAPNSTTFYYDLTIAPTGRETFVFSFEALNAGDFSGNVVVKTASTTENSVLRVIISPVAVANEEPPEDEIPPETDIEPEEIIQDLIPFRSVVQIFAVIEINGQLYDGPWGSGTVISEEGLILTNAHVVFPPRFNAVALKVSITREQDRPPEETFYAEILQADLNLDLAVIKIISDINGNTVDFTSFGITPVPLGSSDSLQLGDPITIIGYPGIGGETITLTRGEVSGFTSQPPFGNRAFIKTSATIAGGNSGGLAANESGEIIGIPTQLGSGDAGGIIVDCRPLADTNRDGVVDDRDLCVSTGGFINALRPVSLALPLIDAAMAGEVSVVGYTNQEEHQEYEPEGDVVLVEDFSNNNNNWLVGETETSWVDVENGYLVMDIYSNYAFDYSFIPQIYDSVVMVAAGEVFLPVGDGEIGFICGYQGVGNFTVLNISEDGFFTIWKFVNSEYTVLVDWTYSEAIQLNDPFTIAAYCGADRLALAINDTLLIETTDPNYLPGFAGLYAGTWESAPFSVGYDDFLILEP